MPGNDRIRILVGIRAFVADAFVRAADDAAHLAGQAELPPLCITVCITNALVGVIHIALNLFAVQWSPAEASPAGKPRP